MLLASKTRLEVSDLSSILLSPPVLSLFGIAPDIRPVVLIFKLLLKSSSGQGDPFRAAIIHLVGGSHDYYDSRESNPRLAAAAVVPLVLTVAPP